MDGRLVFGKPHDGSGRLVFGDDSGGTVVVPDAYLGIDAGLPGLDGAITLRAGAGLGIDAELPGMGGEVSMLWDANVSRGMRAPLQSAWQQGAPVAAAIATRWQTSASLRQAVIGRWQSGAPCHTSLRTPWQATEPLRTANRSYWQVSDPRRAAMRTRWETAVQLRAALVSNWQVGDRRRAALRSHWQTMLQLRHATRAHWQESLHMLAELRSPYRDGQPMRIPLRSHWQEAQRPPPGISKAIGPAPRQPCYDPATIGRLVFDHPHDGLGRLVFICTRSDDPALPPATIIVLPRRTYMTMNHIAVQRADDGTPLLAETLSMTLDRDSWTWSWSATFERSAREALQPTIGGEPVELIVTINSQPFRLQAEKIGRSVRFPERLVKASGRGKAALLDAPHSPVQSFGSALGRTAHQLMQDVLTVGNVPFGWSVDFGLVDWLVPGGVWAHQGTWISALAEIAAAAGGYLQPHDTASVVRVLPSWPKPWWRWNEVTPDIELPAGVAEIEETEWLPQPTYNRVYVRGETTGGVLGNYKRAGTAGDVLKPMVVHPLITAEEVARQRAEAELSASGRLVQQSLTMMVLAETGVIKPGTFVRYTDDDGAARLGLVRSTSLAWQFPVLTQTIGIERNA